MCLGQTENKCWGGGTVVICRSSMDPSAIKIQFLDSEEFEYTAILINRLRYCNKPVLLISLYRPSSLYVNKERWNNLISNIEDMASKYNVLLCSDFNAQHFTWGSSRPNASVEFLANAVSNSSMIALNDGSSTRISANESLHVSAPDLSFISSTLSDYVAWGVLDDTMNSDHLLIEIELKSVKSSNEPDLGRRPRLSLSKFNKDLFCALVDNVFSSPSGRSDFPSGAEQYEYWYD